MKATKCWLVCLLAIPSLLAASCSTPAPPGVPTGTPTGAPAGEPPQAVIVGGEPATYTVVPTYTPPSTYTPVPTYTPVATYTPGPTFTPLLPDLPTTLPPAELSDLEQEMWTAINAERARDGLDALVLDPVLTELARGHAQDMVDREYRDHVTPEGVTYQDRLQERGIEVRWQGENWYGDNCSRSEIVECAMEWMIDDPSHRDNILHDRYTRVGIGIVQDGLDGYLIVQNFTEDW